jgi:predicted AlkP superfamily pyrophosphatase or phosphodiesterase
MNTTKLLIISVDALNAKDFTYISNLPNFKQFIEKGSHVANVFSIYPSLTYCCHTSIISGNYPERHGIFHNEIANPSDPLLQEWFWHKDAIKSPTLFDIASANGLTTASVLWPVMAHAKKAIHHNIPEIWSDHGKSSLSLFLKNGSLHLLPLVLKHQKKLNGKKQPFLDNFSEAVAIDILKKKRPDLMALHLTELDTMRHMYGVFSEEAYKALDSADTRIGHIIQVLKEENLYTTTNIVLLGDHGGTDYTQAILLNSLFKQEGLIETDANNQILRWKAYANGAGGSCQIVLSAPSDSQLLSTVSNLLNNLLTAPNSPLLKVFSKEEALNLHHLAGNFSFIAESKEGYIFKNNVTESLISNLPDINCTYICDHGYLPSHENMRTLLFAKGPNIQSGHVIPSACLVDEGPTFAKLLNLNLKNTDGVVLEDMLKH